LIKPHVPNLKEFGLTMEPSNIDVCVGSLIQFNSLPFQANFSNLLVEVLCNAVTSLVTAKECAQILGVPTFVQSCQSVSIPEAKISALDEFVKELQAVDFFLERGIKPKIDLHEEIHMLEFEFEEEQVKVACSFSFWIETAGDTIHILLY
jgi:hypothetical protein